MSKTPPSQRARSRAGKRHDIHPEKAQRLGVLVMTCEGFTLGYDEKLRKYVGAMRWNGVAYKAIGNTAKAVGNLLVEQTQAKPVPSLADVLLRDEPQPVARRTRPQPPSDMAALYQERWDAAVARGDVYQHLAQTKLCVICGERTHWTDGIVRVPVCGPAHLNDAQHEYGGRL